MTKVINGAKTFGKKALLHENSSDRNLRRQKQPPNVFY